MHTIFRIFTMLTAAGLPTLPTAQATIPAIDEKDGMPTLAPLLRKITPGVVNIAVRSRIRIPSNRFLMDPRFLLAVNPSEMPQEHETQSVSFGVIVDAAKGHILTNHHVVADADEITITLTDQRHIKAKLVASDWRTDIALLQVQANKLTAIPMGNSDLLEMDDHVISIGNPFGHGRTAVPGIVSALGRGGLTPEGYEDLIQTDAVTNPGNSGGALISLRDELVGINTPIIAPSGGNVGIGFAVPVNTVRAVMRQLLRYGEVRRSWLGVFTRDLTLSIGTALGIARDTGVLVTGVVPGSPADEAGIKLYDAITAYDGKRVASMRDLRKWIGHSPIGTNVRLTVLRENRDRIVNVTIDKRRTAPTLKKTRPPGLIGAIYRDAATGSGVLIASASPGSAAWRHGLREGDIIISVNRRPVRSTKELMDHARNRDRPLALNVRRDDRIVQVMIP